MKPDEVSRLYDDEYAASYEEKFLLSPLSRSDTEYEVALLGELLADGGTWLDVACGTGFFLRRFPQIERAGLDISPAMLRLAREGNPDIALHLRDFRDPFPAWHDRWDLVSCMWYAYGLVDTVEELSNLVRNLWAWTSSSGTCFVPLADPTLMTGVELPYRISTDFPDQGRIVVTGIIWSYEESGGRRIHRHQLAPQLDFMVEQFEPYFDQVEILRYPPAFPGWQGRPALLARRKRPLDAVP